MGVMGHDCWKTVKVGCYLPLGRVGLLLCGVSSCQGDRVWWLLLRWTGPGAAGACGSAYGI